MPRTLLHGIDTMNSASEFLCQKETKLRRFEYFLDAMWVYLTQYQEVGLMSILCLITAIVVAVALWLAVH
jgi:hypothetical protein